MFLIQETMVESPLATTQFACDLNRCKGACCTIPGGRGAPLLDEEIDDIRTAFPRIKKYLSQEHLRAIEQVGLFEGAPGHYATSCVNDRACVFVTYENGIARCSFETAYLRGEIRWRKPLSCHLFPIRVDRERRTRLRYEFLTHCTPALERGEQEQISLAEFSRQALERAFGVAWYREFIDAARRERELTKSRRASIRQSDD
jgi:hypothetical protein